MADKNASVGIGVSARVDRTVPRAFHQLEQQNKRLGRGTRRLGRETRSLGRESRGTGRSVTTLGRRIMAAGKNVQSFTQKIGDAARKSHLMRKSINKMADGLDQVGNKWTALASGAAGVGSAHAVMGLEERYERLGIQAGKSKEEMAALRAEMFATAQQSDIRVDQGEMLAAVEKIVEKTGDLKFAQENMTNIGRVMQATGAEGADVGEMFADMSQKFGLKNSKDVLSAIDTLVVQGKAGAFTLQNLASEGASVAAAYAAMGRTGPKAVQEMGALLQMSRMGSGSAAEAASSMESVLEDITANYSKIEKLGIQVFDEEALERGEKKFRSIPVILKEIMAATNGDITQYSQLFGDEAMRTLKVLAGEDGKKLDQFLSISGDGTAVLQDSARAAKTANAAMTSLKTAWMSFADKKLAEPIAALADLINDIDPDTLSKALTGATAVAGALGVAWAGRKVWKTGKSIAGFFRGKDKRTTPESRLASNDVAKVYVTNMPGSGFGGGDSSSENGRKRGRKRRRFRTRRGGSLRGESGRLKRLLQLGQRPGLLKGLTRRIPYVGALMGAVDIGSTLMDDSLSREQKSKAVGGTAGGLGGALAGAAIGSWILPGIGTAIGGLIGGLGGESIGRWVGGMLKSTPGDKIQQTSNHYRTQTVNQHTVDQSDHSAVYQTDPKPDQSRRRSQPGDTINHQVQNQQRTVNQSFSTVTQSQQYEMTNLTNRVQNHQSSQQNRSQITFAPVFHVQGNVNDEQINKLEKMVMRVAKQMEKFSRSPRNVGFADS
ncbi:phage tail tape measure protein [Vibrio spartinae]|uniref:Phage-related minor tail protein n=1 Tax=Vibrio spartinae TaxID=1918945 RepID=A0A1N6M5K7_9VIBR|nr:phage tail tape measure protein [Vibrio spartinae]SIO94670.1 Phage-related minor tail protein [Vibrio spartinae]